MTKWDSKSGQDSKVVARGGWGDLPDCLDNFPARAGVYVFADVELQVKYVGKAGAGRLQKEAKNAYNVRDKGSGATKATWLATNSDDNAKSLESDLIDEYDPPNN